MSSIVGGAMSPVVSLGMWLVSLNTAGLASGLSALLAALSAALALPIVMDGALSLSHRVKRRQRTLGEEPKASFILGIASNGLLIFRKPAQLINHYKPWFDCCRRIQQFMAAQNQAVTVDAISELLIGGCLLLGMLIGLLSRQVFCAIALAGLAPLLADNYVSGKLRKRNQLMREQLPDALQCLGFCFLAGCSLPQAIEQTAAETPEPLKSELEKTSDDLISGLGVRESLQALEERNSLPELSFMAVALEIQHQTGGSLKDLLEAAAESVRTAVNLKKQLQVQTAQARLSFKIVALMPVVLMLVLSLAMDGYLKSFFSSGTGLMILLTAVAMEALGILMIHRILGVDLG